MKNIDNLFSEFIDNLSLTDAQRKDAKTKYTGVIDCLAKHFYDRDANMYEYTMKQNKDYEESIKWNKSYATK